MSKNKMAGKFEGLAVWGIIFLLLLAPVELLAGKRKGTWLRVKKNDGNVVEGELLKVSGETLFLFDKGVQRGVQVNMGEIDCLGLRNKSNVLGGIGAGFFVGIGAGLVAGKILESKEPCENVGTYMGTFMIGIPLGMIVGGVTNGFRRQYKTRQVAGLNDVDLSTLLGELNALAREIRW